MPSVATLHGLCCVAITHLKWFVVLVQETPLLFPAEATPKPSMDFLKTYPDSYMHVKTGFHPPEAQK